MSGTRRPEDIIRIVLCLRKKLGLEKTERLHPKSLLDSVKQYFPDFNYHEVPDGELPDAEGMYDPSTHTIVFPTRVFSRLDKDEPRISFTVGHELAHYVLNHQEIRFRHSHKKAYERVKSNIDREEVEANQFAAFLLAPDHLCQDCKTVDDFMSRFGLSRPAAEIRKHGYDRHLRRINGEERPLTPNVIDLLQHLRNKGHKITSLKDGPQPQLIAVAVPAQKHRTNKSTAPDSRTRYMPGACTVCRNPTVYPLSHKFKCDTCHTVFDQFQDGDIVDL